ncbi:MAG: glycoside hydrolase family 88 protein, partial [Alistipes sp.]|nr:glycoside hydrolase family 88 protein [Alistipes sp.]
PESAKYDSYRERILVKYKEMMATLHKYQRSSGLWGQLITPDKGDMWEETSGSAMFTYAMILGVKNGWLDERIYGTVARKGWLGTQNYLNTNYEIRNVCCGTGTGTSYEYYRDRDKYVGDLHGQAAMMWCAYALTELAAGR